MHHFGAPEILSEQDKTQIKKFASFQGNDVGKTNMKQHPQTIQKIKAIRGKTVEMI